VPPAGNIGAALKAVGFHEILSGDHAPPVSQYRLGDEEGEFYAEFLAPLRGSGHGRDGTPDATVALAGVTAQKLRYLDVLIQSPWVIRLDTVHVPLISPAEIMLPNPVSFIGQRLLIEKYRQPAKQAQDVLYIHDTLELFRDQLDMLKTVWQRDVRPTLPAATARAIAQRCDIRFRVVTDVIRNAVRIPQDRVITPDRLRATCAYGLGEIFGAGGVEAEE
jgi:hypothetical protein